MKNLSIDNLRTFVTTVDMEGFAKAGELLGKSQPAVSLQIRKLEEQLNIKLFQKEGQRLFVNDTGRRLYEMARKLLQQNDLIVHHFAQSRLQGRVHLGIPSEFATTLLPTIIGKFNASYPDVSLEVTSSLSAELRRQNRSKPFDLMLHISLKDSDNDDPYTLEDELVWVGPKNVPLPEQELLLVLAPDGCRYRERAMEHLKQFAKKWRITFTHADLTGISAAIQEGMGITVLAKSIVPKELEVIDDSTLPKLGKIKIVLSSDQNKENDSAEKLKEFIFERLAIETE